MSAFNEFRCIGRVYGDPRLKSIDSQRFRTYFTLVIDSSLGEKKNFLPIVAPSHLSEKAKNFCRNGNLVALIGEMITKETYCPENSSVDVHVSFVATDIQLIEKVNRKQITDNDFTDVLKSIPLERGNNDI